MNVFGMFVKQPQPGFVKTRLAAEIGAEQASSLYEAFLADQCAKFADAADRRILCYSPSTHEAKEYFKTLAANRFELWPQPELDLGGRMQAFFENHLTRKENRVLIIGSDSPLLPEGIIEQGFELLSENDCVIGPATDGGYYLLGMRKQIPTIFKGIDWSSDRVLKQTIDAISASQATLGLLPPWYDVDTLEDLLVLRGHLDAFELAGKKNSPESVLKWTGWDTLEARSGL